MRVVLLNPPSAGGRVSRGLMGGYGMRVGRGLVYPPIQLAWVAAVLEGSGHRVEILDAEARGDTGDDVLRAVSDGEPAIVGMVCSQDQLDGELALARRMRREAGSRVCLIGPMAFSHPERCLADGAADWVLVGEPDLAFTELADRVEATGGAGDMAGIASVVEGEHVVRPGRHVVDDLDALPLPARHLLDRELYRYPGSPLPMTTVHASRGCPIGCPFCAYVFTEGHKLRTRSAAAIAAELEQARDLGIGLVVFRDPIFTIDRRRIVELAARLVELDRPVEWICETALRFVDDELLATMAEAGCRGLSFGIESANAQLQAKYAKDKIGSKEHAAAVVASCRRLGIRTRAFFMMGFPEETAAMREETVDFAVELEPDSVQFVPLTPFAGTPMYDEALAADAARDPAVRRSIRRAYRRFYGRPGRLLGELRDPGRLLRKTGRYLSLLGS